MTLVQMEYVLEVLKQQSFAKAANKLGLTQPTLSMQIGKLEEELGQTLINREVRPIVPTPSGIVFVERAREILANSKMLENIYKDKSIIPDEIKIGIIPTISPYLIPHLLPKLISSVSGRILVNEMTTDEIVEALNNESIEIGILATPLKKPVSFEYPLFHEDFLVYLPKNHALLKQKKISRKDIKQQRLILLDEGHCLRDQVLQLCSRETMMRLPFGFKTGNLETIIKLVDQEMGITILPYMATLDLKPEQKKRLRKFMHDQPARQVSLVGKKYDENYEFVRRIIQSLEQSTSSIGLGMQHNVNILSV